MARLPGVARGDAPEDIARVYDGATARFGKLLDPLVVTAHNPDVFRAYVGFEAAFAQAHAVDERLKALAALKSAALIGCPFCVDLGSTEARASGLSDDQLKALPTYRESALFSPLEKAVLDYTTAMTRTPVVVSDALFATLREYLSPAAVVELTSMIALENYRSRFNHAVGIGSQGFSEGSYCVRPETA
jgi:AhpD family alkylhydroperoxidase